MYDAILVNGDSYSAGNSFPVWPEHLGKILGKQVYNISYPGSSNKRILRSTIEYTLKLQQKNIKPLVIIGWSFIRRQEVWYYGESKTINHMFPEQHSKLVTLDVLLENNLATYQQKALLMDPKEIHKALVDFWTDVWLLTQALDNFQTPHWFFSAADNTDCPVNCFPYIDNLLLTQDIINNPRVYKINEFCIPLWGRINDKKVGVTGHLSADGHREFAKFIAEQIKNIC